MSSSTLQLISAFIVSVGVGLCATFGAQLTPKTLEAITVELSSKSQADPVKQSIEVEEPLARVSAWWSSAGAPFGGGLLLIFLGSFLARSAKKASLSEGDNASESTKTQSLNDSLQSVISRLEETIGANLSLEEIKIAIEDVQHAHLTPMIDGRERTKSKIGTAAFIDIFGPIAQGERKLNRAWAACVDKHQTEATSSLSQALEAFKLARSLSV